MPLANRPRRALPPGGDPAAPRRTRRRDLAPACLGLALAGLARPRRAVAHALVVESAPPAGAVLAAPPARIVVRFNSRIDPERSRLTLVGPGGGDPVAVALDPPPAEATRLEADCPPLAPGAWRLRWQVLAVDGHITRGDIPFTVRP